MAKIYIKSREPILVEAEKALQIKNDWIANPRSKDIAEINGESFPICDIKGFGGIIIRGSDYVGKRYNLDVPEDRQKVREFESEFLVWRNGDGKKYSSIMAEPRFLEAKKACSFNGEGKYISDIVIRDVALYERLSSLCSALQSLRIRRQIARGAERQSMDVLIKDKEELKEKISIEKDEL